MISLESINQAIEIYNDKKLIDLTNNLYGAYTESVMTNIALTEISVEDIIEKEQKKLNLIKQHVEKTDDIQTKDIGTIKKVINSIKDKWNKLVTSIVGEEIETYDISKIVRIMLEVATLSDHLTNKLLKDLSQDLNTTNKNYKAVIMLSLGEYYKQMDKRLSEYITKMEELHNRLIEVTKDKTTVRTKTIQSLNHIFSDLEKVALSTATVITSVHKTNIVPFQKSIDEEIKKLKDNKDIPEDNEYTQAKKLIDEFSPNFIPNITKIYDIRNKIVTLSLKTYDKICKDMEKVTQK